MKAIIATLLWLIVAALALSSGVRADWPDNVMPGEITLVFNVEMSPSKAGNVIETGYSSLDSLLDLYDAVSLEPVFVRPTRADYLLLFLEFEMDKNFLLTVPTTFDLDSLLGAFESNQYVSIAAPNQIAILDREPYDYDYEEQWYHNDGLDVDLDSPEAWEYDTSGTNALLAILDSGIDWTHDDLDSNIWYNLPEFVGNGGQAGVDDDGNGWIDDSLGWDARNFDNNPRPGIYDVPPYPPPQLTPTISHATNIAGVVAAVANNLGDYPYGEIAGVM